MSNNVITGTNGSFHSPCNLCRHLSIQRERPSTNCSLLLDKFRARVNKKIKIKKKFFFIIMYHRPFWIHIRRIPLNVFPDVEKNFNCHNDFLSCGTISGNCRWNLLIVRRRSFSFVKRVNQNKFQLECF